MFDLIVVNECHRSSRCSMSALTSRRWPTRWTFDFDVFRIRTKLGECGGTIPAKTVVPIRDHRTRRQVMRPRRSRLPHAPGQHGAHLDRQHRDPAMTTPRRALGSPTAGKHGTQIDWRRIRPAAWAGQREQRSATMDRRTRHRSGDRAGVATAMITGGTMSTPLLSHHRRVRPQTRRSVWLFCGLSQTQGQRSRTFVRY
jgi:hypothetical protein